MIVWDLVLDPGQSTGVRRHELDFPVHVTEASTLLATDGNGENPAEVTLQPGDTFYFAVKGDVPSAGEIETTAVHDAKNTGTTRYREIVAEMK